MGINSEVVKRRHLSDPRALQMLREPGAARLARKAIPPVINGVTVIFPNIHASAGRDVYLRSKRLGGRSLEDMIWDPECQDIAVDMGIVALQALAQADFSSEHLTSPGNSLHMLDLALFGAFFNPIRTIKVSLIERLRSPLLSPKEQMQLLRLLSMHLKRQGRRKRVLVHGDLHAANLIAEPERKTLAFVDLEMMHIGEQATNFAQLWVCYNIADPLLGRKFYERYLREMAETVDESFDLHVRKELALRCHALVLEGRKTRNRFLQRTASALLQSALCYESFERICYTSAKST